MDLAQRTSQGDTIPSTVPHALCVLVTDAVSLQGGASLRALRRSVDQFAKQLAGNCISRDRVELAIVEGANGGLVLVEPTAPGNFKALPLKGGGAQALITGIDKAFDLTVNRHHLWEADACPVRRPCVAVISNGSAGDCPPIQFPHECAPELLWLDLSSGSIMRLCDAEWSPAVKANQAAPSMLRWLANHLTASVAIHDAELNISNQYAPPSMVEQEGAPYEWL